MMRIIQLWRAKDAAGRIRTGSVVLDTLEGEPALRGVVGRIDQDRRAGQARVGPHIAPHEVIGPILGERVQREANCTPGALGTH